MKAPFLLSCTCNGLKAFQWKGRPLPEASRYSQLKNANHDRFERRFGLFKISHQHRILSHLSESASNLEVLRRLKIRPLQSLQLLRRQNSVVTCSIAFKRCSTLLELSDQSWDRKSSQTAVAQEVHKELSLRILNKELTLCRWFSWGARPPTRQNVYRPIYDIDHDTYHDSSPWYTLRYGLW